MKHPSSARRCAGFTLVELMCVVTMAGVLSSIAYPTYQGVVHKTRRSEAQVATLQAQMAQDRFRADHASYGSLDEIGLPPTTPGGHYTLTIAAHSATGYEVRAAAVASQTADTACRHLRVVVDGFNVAYGSGPDTGFGNSGTVNKKCWGQ